ncbi:MAG: 16S rRNA (adenine(1518)-N(6)/adenine(1519)-N(6))-dimethyltransferase RsmA [Candidatus Thermoplasmatota archaeon]
MRFSQNFLIDEKIAERQVSYANLNENDVVLEIGAGNGILTKKIAKIAKVIAIEIDEKFIPKLKNIKNVDVINADITKFDLNDIYFNKVISNIPYHISSEITFKLLEKKFDLGIIMYQKEFAERLVARGGKNYSRLSVMAYSKADIEILEIVPKKAFRPIPKVDSCIVKILPIGKRFDVNEKIFEKVVRFLFAHRRKKIKNSLALAGLLSKEEAEKIDVAELRVEEISPEKIAEICKFLEERNGVEKNI